ncbi:MAG: hypothetical protein FJX75_03910 [Armatimonadetes bacterium]|nr:hypothetical protein [Armatimonadota bacterium]
MPSVCAQTEVYCNLTDIKVDRLSNATRITLNTDGMVRGTFDPGNFQVREGNYSRPRPLRSFPLRLVNCRTKLGSFVDVSAYPISHVSLSIPRESREGVGLEVQVVLYKRGYLDYIWLGQDGFGMWVPEPPGVSAERSRDGHSIVVIATSDRYYEPEPPRTEVAPSESSLSVTADDAGCVTVHALNRPLSDVLRRISEATGLRVTIGGGANYRTSLAVRQVPPEDLMRAIARAYGLSVRSVGGVYYVTEGLPTEVDSYWAAPTATFRLQHLPADEAVELLPDFLLRYVHVNPGDNAVVATGPPQLLDKLDADLRKIDRPTPQIRLSAMIVEQVTQGALDAASALIFADGRHEFTTNGDTGRLGYRLVEDHLSDLQLKLRALREAGTIRTRVCPSVTVGSGAQGELFLGRRQFFAFARPVYTGETMTQEVVLESADVGSRVLVEPWSGDGQTITLALSVQANTVLTVDRQGLPLVATRSAKGTVRVASGDTIVFGGLGLESSEDRHRRARPFRLPLIGDLGRARNRTENVTQALVLLGAQASYDPRSFAPTPEPRALSLPRRSSARPPNRWSSERPEALQRWYR